MEDYVSVFVVPPLVLGKQSASYLAQFVQIVSASSKNVEFRNYDWPQSFHQLSWCRETENEGHWSFWPAVIQPVGRVDRLVTSPLPTQRRPLEFWPSVTHIPFLSSLLFPSSLGMSTIGTGVVKPTVGSNARPPFPEKPLPAACADAEKQKGYWLLVGKTRENFRTARHQSPEDTTGKDTHSPTISTRPATQKQSGISVSSTNQFLKRRK